MGNQIIIVVYDTDEEYITGINEYLLDYINERYSIFTFSNIDKFREFCETNNINILILAEYCIDIKLIKNIDAYIQILSEEKNVLRIQGYEAVYRYRKMCMIISDILNNYANYTCKNSDVKDNILDRDMNVRITAIYSPVNRCGKSTLCMKLAYALKENKSLIIDLEEFSLNKDIFDGGLNISDLIYYCLKENSNFNIKLDAIVKKYNNTDIIPPVNNISDISEINEDIWAELIIKIKDSGRYGDIIIDVSNMVGDIFKIFKICDYVFVPHLNDNYSSIKLKLFFNYLENVNNELKNTVIKKIDVSNVLSKGDDYIIKQMTDIMMEGNIG